MPEDLSLSSFIRKALGPITEEWRDFAETLASPPTTDLLLRDHIHQILFFIADDIESTQTAKQQVRKSQGKNDNLKGSPGAIHAGMRFDIGFNMVEMVSEYRALRATIIKLWTSSRTMLTDPDVLDLIRFNESIDQLIAQSIASFLKKLQPKPK